jgi:hypothetical protein
MLVAIQRKHHASNQLGSVVHCVDWPHLRFLQLTHQWVGEYQTQLGSQPLRFKWLAYSHWC